MDEWEKPDRVLYELLLLISKRFIKVRRKIENQGSSLAAFDELNILFKDVEELVTKALLDILIVVYEDHSKKKREFDLDYATGYLDEYNGLTEYVFSKEFQRKKERLQESVMSVIERHKDSRSRVDSDGEIVPLTKDIERVFNSAYSNLSKMIQQYEIVFADAGRIEAFKDNGVKLVRWRAEHDDRTCDVCEELDGNIFPIDKVPDKPHLNCRCVLEKVDK